MNAAEDKRTLQDLQQLQALPLKLKISLTKQRIRQWVNEFGVEGVYISFSGGKDSTVLLHLVRELYPNVEAVFCDTGLEYPEIREFVKTFDNVTWLKPKINFRKVVEQYGYPFISKEVSECVQGARKYLDAVLNGNKNVKPDGKPMPNHTYIADLLGVDRRTNKDNPDYQALKDGIIPGLIENAPIRTKILFGRLKHTENGVETDEYSRMYDKSRYLFFVDAPFQISNKCCTVMKKTPFSEFKRKTGKLPILATMASESRLRTQKWLLYGCNAFDSKKQMSSPMSFWTEQDVLLYIYENHIPICSVYGDVIKVNEVDGQTDWADYGIFDLERPMLKTTGCDRTGCMFCGFGCHLEKAGEGRFERMKETHPKQYAYIMKPWDEGGLGYKEVIDWINEHGNLNIRY